MALATLLQQSVLADSPVGSADPLAPRASHFPARAKRIIFLHMAGAPSQLICLILSQNSLNLMASRYRMSC